MGEDNVIEFNPHFEATVELDWFFNQAESLVRIKGTDYRTLGAAIGAVEDDARTHRRHMMLRDLDEDGKPLGGGETRLDASGQHVGPYRAAVARKSKIEATFAQLPIEHQRVIALAFEPRRYIGDGGAVEIELRQRMTFGGRDEGSVRVCLLALAVASSTNDEPLAIPPECVPDFSARKRELPRQPKPLPDRPPRAYQALADAAQRAGNGGASDRQGALNRLEEAKSRAWKILAPALAAYDAARRARIDAERDIERERVARAAREMQDAGAKVVPLRRIKVPKRVPIFTPEEILRLREMAEEMEAGDRDAG